MPEYRPSENNEQCSNTAHGSTAAKGSICIDLSRPIVWRRGRNERPTRGWEPIRFEPPAPYKTRDVVELVAFSQTSFLFTLSNGQLYVWDGNVSSPVREAFVDSLHEVPRGWVYYRSKRLSKMGTVTWNAIERVKIGMEPETIWESDEVQLVRLWRLGTGAGFRATITTPSGQTTVLVEELVSLQERGR